MQFIKIVLTSHLAAHISIAAHNTGILACCMPVRRHNVVSSVLTTLLLENIH